MDYQPMVIDLLEQYQALSATQLHVHLRTRLGYKVSSIRNLLNHMMKKKLIVYRPNQFYTGKGVYTLVK